MVGVCYRSLGSSVVEERALFRMLGNVKDSKAMIVGDFNSVAPIHRFLGGQHLFWSWKIFFLRRHAKNPVSAPPIKAIHVLKCTKA